MRYEHQYGQERKQMRWADFDYSSQGVYFITIVTHSRWCLFGNVVNGEMASNDAGRMVMDEYQHLEQSMSGVECMDAVVMPNHFHALVYLSHDGGCSLSDVLWQLKSKTTNRYIHGVRKLGWPRFDKQLWQTSYWDDIVWNGRMFQFIQRYIALNPERWDRDLINDDHIAVADDIRGCLDRLRRI